MNWPVADVGFCMPPMSELAGNTVRGGDVCRMAVLSQTRKTLRKTALPPTSDNVSYVRLEPCVSPGFIEILFANQ